jgi:isopenicillin N synthase-like dioxygenase
MMVLYTPPGRATIPVIDISATFTNDSAARADVARAIGEACRTMGFFYVAGHGVGPELIARQFAAAQAFFARPMDEKMTCSTKLSPTMRGFEPMGPQALDPDSPPDLKEGFALGIERGPDHPLVRNRTPRHGPNNWPTADHGFKSATLGYFNAVLGLGGHLMRLIALSLDLPERYFDGYFSDPNASLRLLHYPPHPVGAPANQLGAGTHTDWGAITILAQDSCGGLEVQTSAGDWIRAEPIEGTFVVNLGDLLARWTNDLYQSTPHRVLNNVSGRDRYSAALFYDPDYHARIECLPGCRDDNAPVRYAPCTAGEHNLEMYYRSRGQSYQAAAPA